MKAERSCVAVFRTHTDADKAVKMLQRAGVDMKRLSVVGRGYHSEDKVLGFYNTGERMKGWGKWGGLLGLDLGAPVRRGLPHHSGFRPPHHSGPAGIDRGRCPGRRDRRRGARCPKRRTRQHRRAQG
jgi:hypothetical protein